MRSSRSLIIVSAIVAMCVVSSTSYAAASADKCTIAWSHYTGWEPIQYMKDSGILAKWASKYDVDLDITPPMDYVESINQYTSNQFCAVAITNMDALTIPAIGGVDTTFLVVGDYSNGNDGILFKSAKQAALGDLLGRKIMLVENTVSQYLLARAFQISKLELRSVRLVNVSDSDIGALFAAGRDGTAVVTWNPILMTAESVKDSQLLFDSSKIPGEIIDGIAIHTDGSDRVKKAVTGAWFEVMKIMAEKGSVRQQDAIRQMANSAGGTEAGFIAQLRTTYLFSSPMDAARFTRDSQLKATMDFVRKFLFDVGLFTNVKSVDALGIQFPDGTVLGDPKNVRLRFDAKYMDMAAKGGL